jgi:hypothetical protein
MLNILNNIIYIKKFDKSFFQDTLLFNVPEREGENVMFYCR